MGPRRTRTASLVACLVMLLTMSTNAEAAEEAKLRAVPIKTDLLSSYGAIDLFPVSNNRTLVFTRTLYIPYQGTHVGALLMAANGTVLKHASISSLDEGYGVLMPENEPAAGSDSGQGLVLYLEFGEGNGRELRMRTFNPKNLTLGDPVTITTFGAFDYMPHTQFAVTRVGTTIFCAMSSSQGRNDPGYLGDVWFIVFDTDGTIISPMYHYSTLSQLDYDISKPVWTGKYWMVPYAKSRNWSRFNDKKAAFLSAGIFSIRGFHPDLKTAVKEKKFVSSGDIKNLYDIESIELIQPATTGNGAFSPEKAVYTVMLNATIRNVNSDPVIPIHTKLYMTSVRPRGNQVGTLQEVSFTSGNSSPADESPEYESYHFSPPVAGDDGSILFVRKYTDGVSPDYINHFALYTLDTSAGTATSIASGKTENSSSRYLPTLSRYGNYFWSAIHIPSKDEPHLFFRYREK